MVKLYPVLNNFIKVQAKKRKILGFLDSLTLKVRAGAGGMGCPKFGGIGGKGGDVILEAKEGVTLKNVKIEFHDKIVKASKGADSHERCILGKPGKSFTVNVPTGVNVTDQQNRIIGELNQPNSKLIVARGGPGGCLENGFSGRRGESFTVRLDLKLIADIGLVGFPNAGKSTLLRAITDAKPKIAAYPFTTITPNVGKVNYPDLRTITIADLPGLIEDAHKNVGMGHRFLRHCERTKLLILVVDISGFQLNNSHIRRSCLETVVLLNKEMEMYKDSLLKKPTLLLVNKMDLPGANEEFQNIKDSLQNLKETISKFPDEIKPYRALTFDDIIPISAKTSEDDVKKVKLKLRNYLDLYDDANDEDAESRLLKKLQSTQTEYNTKYV